MMLTTQLPGRGPTDVDPCTCMLIKKSDYDMMMTNSLIMELMFEKWIFYFVIKICIAGVSLNIKFLILNQNKHCGYSKRTRERRLI